MIKLRSNQSKLKKKIANAAHPWCSSIIDPLIITFCFVICFFLFIIFYNTLHYLQDITYNNLLTIHYLQYIAYNNPVTEHYLQFTTHNYLHYILHSINHHTTWFLTGSCRTRTTSQNCCVFPFIYRGRRYTRCTTVNSRGKPWCAITPSYDADKLYGYCGGRGGERRTNIALETNTIIQFIYFIQCGPEDDSSIHKFSVLCDCLLTTWLLTDNKLKK